MMGQPRKRIECRPEAPCVLMAGYDLRGVVFFQVRGSRPRQKKKEYIMPLSSRQTGG
jgi:hypothetical protein